MNKIICLLYLCLGMSFNVVAKSEPTSTFNFKWLLSQSQNVQLGVIDDKPANSDSFLPDSKKGLVIYRSQPVKPHGEVSINFDGSQQSGENGLHKVTAYKLVPLSNDNLTVAPLFTMIDDYTAILEKKYPYRFVTKKRSCMNQQDEFFQCLYNEKETWNTLFFVNNGEISLALLPVINEKDHQVIGGAVMITYTVGTGKRLDRAA